jgi:hypothetical protein
VHGIRFNFRQYIQETVFDGCRQFVIFRNGRELAESGAGDETIMAIAGHVSRRMLTRYSHIRTQAKRAALEDVVARRQKERTLNKEAAEKEAEGAVTVN